MKIWNYFKDSWEDKDGKFSYRRFSQYIFLLCMIKIGFKPPVNQYELTVFIVFAALYALVAALITAQQLIELLKYTLPITLNITNETEQSQVLPDSNNNITTNNDSKNTEM
jgi:hypothetical protein